MVNKQKDRLVELLQEASEEAGKHFRETTKKVLAEKGSFNSATDIERRNIYEVEADHLLANGVIVLPHALGSKVWCLGQPCGGCECCNEPMTEEFIERCRTCNKWEIGECEFDYELIPEWGKHVFPTRELAEEALRKKLEEAKGDAE